MIMYVATDKGTVKIEFDDPNPNVEVRVDGNNIDIAGLEEKPLRLSAGEHGLEVTSEKFKTFTNTFTVHRGEQELVRVALEPKAEIKGSTRQQLPAGEGTAPQPPTTVDGAMERKLDGTLTNSINMLFKLIPAGEFDMGSTREEVERLLAAAKQRNEPQWYIERLPGEAPQHRVRITKLFHLGVHEVTQEQYERVRGQNPSKFMGPQQPVETVSWDDAVKFCDVLSALPEEKAAGRTYRLPTEAEWEYACRAGSTARYSYGDDAAGLGDHAWFGDNSSGTTHSVGEKQPNAWGLYDMQGNVWEWCADWYDGNYYGASPRDDPTGPATGSLRVCWGGSWYFSASCCQSAFRHWTQPSYRDCNLGFRVATVPSASQASPASAASGGSGGSEVGVTFPAEQFQAERESAPTWNGSERRGQIAPGRGVQGAP